MTENEIRFQAEQKMSRVATRLIPSHVSPFVSIHASSGEATRRCSLLRRYTQFSLLHLSPKFQRANNFTLARLNNFDSTKKEAYNSLTIAAQSALVGICPGNGLRPSPGRRKTATPSPGLKGGKSYALVSAAQNTTWRTSAKRKAFVTGRLGRLHISLSRSAPSHFFLSGLNPDTYAYSLRMTSLVLTQEDS